MTFLDDAIRDAMDNGAFDDLPGAGKPINFEDEAHTPEHLRMAHKVLRDNDLAPDWILESKSLDQSRESIVLKLKRAQSRRRAGLDSASRSYTPAQDRAETERQWRYNLETIRAAAAEHNRRILTFNLKAPAGVTHKAMIDIEALLRES